MCTLKILKILYLYEETTYQALNILLSNKTWWNLSGSAETQF